MTTLIILKSASLHTTSYWDSSSRPPRPTLVSFFFLWLGLFRRWNMIKSSVHCCHWRFFFFLTFVFYCFACYFLITKPKRYLKGHDQRQIKRMKRKEKVGKRQGKWGGNGVKGMIRLMPEWVGMQGYGTYIIFLSLFLCNTLWPCPHLDPSFCSCVDIYIYYFDPFAAP